MRSDVEAAWGTPDWARLIADVPVVELEAAEVRQTPPAGLAERVDLATMMVRE